MPNAKVLSEKQAVVAALTEQLKGAASGVLVDYKGITVAEDTALRVELRQNEVQYGVVKNTLARFALNNVGLESLDEVLNGHHFPGDQRRRPNRSHACGQQVRQAAGRSLQHQGRLHGWQGAVPGGDPGSGRIAR